jgi:FkbM family methyltransferase
MLETLHRIGSQIRNAPALRRQAWLWRGIEPGWNYVFRRLTSNRGYAAHVNGDEFLLTYEVASRYDRADQRVYEPVFYKAFVEQVGEGMTVFDVGSHVGFFTLAAAKRVGPEGHVFSFEPTPCTGDILTAHVRFNRWSDRVTVVKQVVSDVEGTITFYTRDDHPTMAASLTRFNVEEAIKLESPQGARVQQLDVPSVTVDSFCRTINAKPDVMKLDVEGAEFKVLLGARNLLREGGVTILCEVHPYLMEKLGSTLNDLSAYLTSLEYRMTQLDEPNPSGIFHTLIEHTKRSGAALTSNAVSHKGR